MKLWINFGKYYFNRKTGDIIYTKPKENPTINFSLPNWKIIKSSDGLEYFFNPKININTWRMPERLKFKLEEYYPYKGPSYGTKERGNTCFIDSALVAIFSTIDPFTNYLLYTPIKDMSQYEINPCKGTGPIASIKSINQVRKELRNLRGMLVDWDRNRESENIHRLLKTIKRCGGKTDKFCDGSIGETASFIDWLLNLLPFANVCIKQNNSFVGRKGKWSLILDQWLFDSAPVIIINPSDITNARTGSYLKDILNTQNAIDFKTPIELEVLGDGLKYSKKLDMKSVKYCTVLFVSLYRNDFADNFNTKPIIPDEFLTLDSGQKLRLTSIIIWGGYHYWCYFYAPGSGWFYYNDSSDEGTPSEVGNYKDLIQIKEVLRQCVMCKYSVVETDYWGQDMPWLQNVPEVNESGVSVSESEESSSEPSLSESSE